MSHTYECFACHGTFDLDPEFDAAAEYVARFGAAPRTDDMVCDDCYRTILIDAGHCATCMERRCTCAPMTDPCTSEPIADRTDSE